MFKKLLLISEGKMSEIDANIRDIMTKAKRVDIKIGKPSTYTHKYRDESTDFIVWPVTFHKASDKQMRYRSNEPKQEYQTYVYAKKGSTEVKSGLPPKRGGEQRTIKNGGM